MRKPAVFLDRDGTINEDTDFIDSPERLIMIDGAPAAIKRLNDNGFAVVIISNQSGVGRGYFNSDAVDAVNRRLEEMLEKEGARIDAVYYCPHHPDDDCACRKPRPGMTEAASERFNIDLKKSYVVGDRVSDVELARNIGGKGILVLTGKGVNESRKLLHQPEHIAENLTDAVEWIIEESGKRQA